MSVEQDIWTQFKTQLQADSTLSSYVTTFKFNNQPQAFDPQSYPICHCYNVRTEDEEFIGVPKKKLVKLIISCSGKARGENGDNLETEILKFDEYLKNAVESNLQLSGKATITKIGDSVFTPLDRTILETKFEIIATSQRFTAGSR